MSNYRVYGTTRENGVLAGNLIIVYKANRAAAFETEAGEELGRVTANSNGLWEIPFSDWPYEIFVVALDLTADVKYKAVIEDWIKAEYVGSDPYFDNVVSLLHMEGTNGGTSFIDDIGNAVVPVGGANTSTVQAKFGSSALQLGGVGDRVEVAYSSAFNMADSNFCVEGWVFQSVNTGTQVLFSRRVLSQNGTYGSFVLRISGGVLHMYFGKTPNAWMSDTTSGTVPTGEWVHIAFSRSGSLFRAFINGIETGSINDSSEVQPSGYPIYIGSEDDGTSPFNGYIDEFRFTVGDARYTQNFVPPSAPFYSLPGDPHFNYVKSLLHMEGTVGGTAFIDEIGNTVTANGLAVTSTAQVKFGGTSGIFPGDGDFLEISNHVDMNFGTKDFTIEGWFWFNSPSTAAQTMICKRPSSSVYGTFLISCSNRTLLVYLRTGSSTWWNVNTANAFSNTSGWQHVAVCRKDGRLRSFIDGVKIADNAISSPIIDDVSPIFLGAEGDGNSNMNGYIDDFRLTIGYARYTDDFTIPAAAFPNA